MDFVQHILTSPLSNWIEAIFHFKNFKPDHSIERVVPTGHLFVLFELDGITRYTYYDDLKVKDEFLNTWVSGMHRNYISISAPQDSEMCVVQFKPFGAHPFIKAPVWELTERIVHSELVFGPMIKQIHQDLKEAGSSKKFEILENWLLEIYDANQQPPEDLVSLVNAFQAAQGAYYELIEGYPHSKKHLIDQFKKYVGLTPKYFHRICRFNELLSSINQKQQFSWAQVAYQCGYSDQSHFIKEFKHFSGFNPQQFIRQEFDQEPPNFFPLDREG